MNGSIHQIVVPIREDLSGGETPRVIACTTTRHDGTLIIVVHANSPTISHDAMIDGMIEWLRPEEKANDRDRSHVPARGNPDPR